MKTQMDMLRAEARAVEQARYGRVGWYDGVVIGYRYWSVQDDEAVALRLAWTNAAEHVGEEDRYIECTVWCDLRARATRRARERSVGILAAAGLYRRHVECETLEAWCDAMNADEVQVPVRIRVRLWETDDGESVPVVDVYQAREARRG